MKCAKCGAEFSITHDCRGSGQSVHSKPVEDVRSFRPAPMVYLREALAIARLNEGAIRRAAHDVNSIIYGAAIMAIGFILRSLGSSLASGIMGRRSSVTLAVVVLGIISSLALSLVSTGILHAAARLLFQANGKYWGLLGALWLGSIATWVGVIPAIGTMIAAIWNFAVFLWVFEEVEGVRRIQAIGLSIGMSAVLWVAGTALSGLVRAPAVP